MGAQDWEGLWWEQEVRNSAEGRRAMQEPSC
jgi:hypothetical protein